ncbi:MAG: hypothetical protein O8C58_03315 [Candidatus Methanoperedens sp.]|nr:hypothetical protein [Candidatus Methanoperedens sp.]
MLSDKIIPTDILDKGQSELVNKIAQKWGLDVDDASLNIKMRTMIKETMARVGKEYPKFQDVDMVSIANNMFWFYLDKSQDESGKVNYQDVSDKWIEWYRGFVEKNK